MFYKIERQRLKYFRDHQKEVHAEKYHGIMDAIHNNDENLVSKNRVILPPSHYLSPRWYAKRLQDTIAICREYGRPHLFVTMTANAKWKGIYDSLHDGLETSPQRPDIVVRYWTSNLHLPSVTLLQQNVYLYLYLLVLESHP